MLAVLARWNKAQVPFRWRCDEYQSDGSLDNTITDAGVFVDITASCKGCYAVPHHASCFRATLIWFIYWCISIFKKSGWKNQDYIKLYGDLEALRRQFVRSKVILMNGKCKVKVKVKVKCARQMDQTRRREKRFETEIRREASRKWRDESVRYQKLNGLPSPNLVVWLSLPPLYFWTTSSTLPATGKTQHQI